LLALWNIEKEKARAGKAPKAARPTRTELDRFLRNGIIDLDTYEAEMAKLGYGKEYIYWFAADVYLSMESEM